MPTREIKLKVSDESELFSPMDPDQEILSDDVISYFARVFLNKHRRLRENYVIRIISDAPINEERVNDAIQKEFRQQKEDLRYALRRLMIKMICLSVLGVAILSLWLYLSATTETVGMEVLSIMGWVCVWEATSILIMQRPDLRRMWFNLDRLTRAKVVYQTTEEPAENAAD